MIEHSASVTRQEWAYAAITQAPERDARSSNVLTTDWDNARSPVQKLAALSSEPVVTDHGRAMEGSEMRAA